MLKIFTTKEHEYLKPQSTDFMSTLPRTIASVYMCVCVFLCLYAFVVNIAYTPRVSMLDIYMCLYVLFSFMNWILMMHSTCNPYYSTSLTNEISLALSSSRFPFSIELLHCFVNNRVKVKICCSLWPFVTQIHAHIHTYTYNSIAVEMERWNM